MGGPGAARAGAFGRHGQDAKRWRPAGASAPQVQRPRAGFAAAGSLIAFKGAVSALRFVGLLGKGGALDLMAMGLGAISRATDGIAASAGRVGPAMAAAAAQTETAAARMKAAVRGVQIGGLLAAAQGAYHFSRVPQFETKAEIEEWQRGNREQLEGNLRSLPGLGGLMELYDDALEWRKGAFGGGLSDRPAGAPPAKGGLSDRGTAPAAPLPSNVSVGGITINAPQNADANAIADEVVRKLADRARGGLHDEATP